jgi:hypothetical protein
MFRQACRDRKSTASYSLGHGDERLRLGRAGARRQAKRAGALDNRDLSLIALAVGDAKHFVKAVVNERKDMADAEVIEIRDEEFRTVGQRLV